MQKSEVATPAVRSLKFEVETRQLSIRNTGVNTLWFTFDGEVWFDLACGTSWDDRIIVKEMQYKTQTGRTAFIATGVRLIGTSK